MTKFRIFYIACLFLFAGCKKSWLEVLPQNQQITKTTQDYKLLMNDYVLYNASTPGFHDIVLLGDELAMEDEYFNPFMPSFVEAFRWNDSIFSSVLSPSSNMFAGGQGSYSMVLYLCNKVINEVDESTGGTDAEKKAVKALAQATRAWSLFIVANVFAKQYNPATATTDPGIPFTAVADVEQKEFSRGTVQHTYDLILADLEAALSSIQPKPDNITQMSRPAVEAILGKVYLSMGKYPEALGFLEASLTHIMANGQTGLHDYNQTLAPGGSFTPIDPFNGPVNAPGMRENNSRESVIYKIFYNPHAGNNGMTLDPKFQSLYEPSDLRLMLYTNLNPDFSPNAGGRLRKNTVQYSRWAIQIPDVYLMIAECKARLNDLAGSVQALEVLRRNRMPVADATVPAPIAGNQTELIKYVFDERLREFAMEGMRWFDMRRMAIDPIFAGIEFKHTRHNIDGTTTEFVLEQPNRLTVKFPKDILDSNPGMQDNP